MQGSPFEVTALPDELAFEVSAGLLFAQRSGECEDCVCWGEGGAGLGFTTEQLCRGDLPGRPPPSRYSVKKFQRGNHRNACADDPFNECGLHCLQVCALVAK